MLPVMLDTNILVDFVLIYWKREKNEKIPSPLSRSSKLLEFYESAAFSNFMSSWNKFELRDVIMKLKLEQKWVLIGYSVREFSYAKREISLTSNERNLVNQVVLDIWKNSTRKTINLNSDDRIKIEELSKSGFSFMDLMLIQQAEKLQCAYFITKDAFLLSNKELLDKKFEVSVIGIREFIDKLRE